MMQGFTATQSKLDKTRNNKRNKIQYIYYSLSIFFYDNTSSIFYYARDTYVFIQKFFYVISQSYVKLSNSIRSIHL